MVVRVVTHLDLIGRIFLEGTIMHLNRTINSLVSHRTLEGHRHVKTNIKAFRGLLSSLHNIRGHNGQVLAQLGQRVNIRLFSHHVVVLKVVSSVILKRGQDSNITQNAVKGHSDGLLTDDSFHVLATGRTLSN